MLMIEWRTSIESDIGPVLCPSVHRHYIVGSQRIIIDDDDDDDSGMPALPNKTENKTLTVA